MRRPVPIKASSSSDERVSIMGKGENAFIELYGNTVDPKRARKLADWLINAAHWVEFGQYEK